MFIMVFIFDVMFMEDYDPRQMITVHIYYTVDRL